jgi:hypothetical protein
LQNQRVEVSGTIAAAPVATPAPPTKPAATPAEPVLTLTVASVKVVSTECK